MKDSELKKLINECCDDIFNRAEPLANVKSRLYYTLKKALRINRDKDGTLILTPADAEIFFKEIMNPKEANEALEKAMLKFITR